MNKIYACSNCGVSLTNRNDWCDLGCGSDYNEMIDVTGRRFIDYSINIKNKLDLIIDKLPLQVDGHKLQIWREKDNTSWDVAYNTDSGNLRPIIWEQARYLSEAVDQMLKRLKVNSVCNKCGGTGSYKIPVSSPIMAPYVKNNTTSVPCECKIRKNI